MNDFLHADGYFPKSSIKLNNFTCYRALNYFIGYKVRFCTFIALSILMHCFISEIVNVLSVMEFSVSKCKLNKWKIKEFD
jgi:hypothetical protein